MNEKPLPRRQFIKQTGVAVAGGVLSKRLFAASRDATASGEAVQSKMNGDDIASIGTPDIIFIGAGINSLGAAYLLSKAGWRVLVLDRNATPGGAIRTLELTLPGFRHDIGAMNLSLFFNSPFYRQHKAALTRAGLRFLVADHSFGSVTTDQGFLGLNTNLDDNLRSIARFSKADAEAWKRWRADYDRFSRILFRVLGSPAVPSSPLELVFGEEQPVSPEAAVPLRGILLESLRANLTKRFESDAVHSLIASWGMHLDYAPDTSGGCWMPFLETNGDERGGIPIAQGGSGRMIAALVQLTRDEGGHVLTNRTVERILFHHGKAAGVRLTDGVEITCSRGVVASVTPQAAVQMAQGELPEAVVAQAENYQYGPGTMVIHLALSALPAWKAEAARRSFYVHVGPTLDYLAAAYQQAMAGQIPAQPVCVIAQPTLYDPSRAPAGKHVLWVMVRGVPARIQGDAGGEIDGRAWTPPVTNAFTDRVLSEIERYAPGLRERILGMAVHTPRDLQQLNPNLVDGDLNAGSMHLSQFYGNRPFAGYADHTLGVPGLYMCGASTWPGGGASPGSGVLLAQRLLAES